mmetsp:Transcript_81324/g.162251  ORF Transcript_81324/g.162251 Transcript_81324/m.162251 type:complete len:513 (-) Transcript_81324:412-1950(-)
MESSARQKAENDAAAEVRRKERVLLSKKLAGIAAIYAIEKAVAKGLTSAKIKVPSSLATMLLWLGGLKSLEVFDGDAERAEAISSALQPAVGFLGKWMTLFLTPPLAMLPMAVKTNAKGTTAEQWKRLFAIHAGGWVLSCVLSSLIAKALATSSSASAAATAVKANGKSRQQPPPPSIRGAPSAEEEEEETDEVKDGDEEDEVPVAAAPIKAVGWDPLLVRWAQFTAAAYCLQRHLGPKPAALGTTVTAIIAASTALPKPVTKVFHPVVVAGAATAASLVISAQARGMASADDAFKSYVNGQGPVNGGAGDLVAALMNAAVSALGLRMFDSRSVLEENWKPLVGGAGASSLFALFGTAWAAGHAQLPPQLGLMLSQRSVMSALGMAGAEQLGASPALAVASILLTGVYGASLGPPLLSALGMPAASASNGASLTQEEEREGKVNEVSRGVAMGASAHAIGTASLMTSEPGAAAVSSVALCVAGIVHTAVLSIPSAQALVKGLASPKIKSAAR